MDEYNVFVRISSNGGNSFENRKMSKTYINNNSNSKYMICGGIYNKNGGTLIYKAKDLKEARMVTEEKPLIKDINTNYNIMFIPKEVKA